MASTAKVPAAPLAPRKSFRVFEAGYGAWWRELNKERVESFLYNLSHYAANLASYPRQGNTALLAKLDKLTAHFTARGRGTRKRVEL